MDWRGLTCLFTGPTSGFGQEAIKLIASKGASLILVSRDEASLRDLVQELGGEPHTYIVADLTKLLEVRRMAEQVGLICDGLDILINAAGTGTSGSLLTTTSEKMQEVIATNLLGPMWCTRELLSSIDQAPRRHRTPVVVNVASMTGRLALLGASDYSASRYGLVGFTEASWKELLPKGIRTMVVNSGWILPGSPGDQKRPPATRLVMEPARVARAMVKGIERGRLEVRVQWWWHVIYHAAVSFAPVARRFAKAKILARK
ncbi:MAG: SDR family NAD(P)-dependent oxidoreductase [Actinomycetota bacterium]|nr:SDR family NAD(P)-dependent oxidoreductase [Actinomycetota bacterium]